MRIAVCLSGHSRNYLQNVPNFPFEVDYFISSCMESGLPNIHTQSFISYHSQNNVRTELANLNDILTKYNPKAWEFLYDTTIPAEVERYIGLKTKNNSYLHHIAMMFYRIYRANVLKSEHERSYNFTYDFVIRSRFDVKVNSFEFDQNYLYMLKGPDGILDLFFAGKSYIIDSICNCYLWFIQQSPDYLQSFNNAENILFHYVCNLKLNQPMLNTFTITFNKDYPVQYSIIKNGLMKSFDQDNHVFLDDLNIL
jgi:hypothetical protein